MRIGAIRNLTALLLLAAACTDHGHETTWRMIEQASAGAPEEAITEVKYPPFSPGIFPCSRCHQGGEPVLDQRPAVPHALHIANDLACADCHGEPEPKIPDAAGCLDCHDLEDESEGARAYFDLIRDESGAYAFPRRWKTRDTIANHAGHAKAGVDCDACHGEPPTGPFRKPKSVALMDRCVACHERNDATVECDACHSEIREPQHAQIVLEHAEEQRGCLDCHNPDDRDTVRLANGSALPFEQSYLLCGQCHGPKLRDWRLGLHGKRTGSWDGHQRYLLCVHCHNPHRPAYPPMTALPPPARPSEIR